MSTNLVGQAQVLAEPQTVNKVRRAHMEGNDRDLVIAACTHADERQCALSHGFLVCPPQIQPPDPVLHPRKYASTNRTVVHGLGIGCLCWLYLLSSSKSVHIVFLTLLPAADTWLPSGISLPYYTAREHHLLQSDSFPGHAPQVDPAGFPAAVPEMSANVPTTESVAFPTAGRQQLSKLFAFLLPQSKAHNVDPFVVPLTMPSIPAARPMNLNEEEMRGAGIVDPGVTASSFPILFLLIVTPGYTGSMQDDVRQYAPVPNAPPAPVAPPSFMARGKMTDSGGHFSRKLLSWALICAM
eukprot:scaffold181076_cov18-Tisochrysis_lutea.AAC.1